MAERRFIREIHVQRGLAILLVVIGHSLFPYNTAEPFQTAYEWVYCFHMHFFFFIAGLCAYRIWAVTRSTLWGTITRRFVRLMIPYFCVSLIAAGPKYILNRYAYAPIDPATVIPETLLGTSPMWRLWFLYDLFVFSVIAACALALTRPASRLRRVVPWLLLTVGIGLYIYSFDAPRMSLAATGLLRYGAFFAGGILCGPVNGLFPLRFSSARTGVLLLGSAAALCTFPWLKTSTLALASYPFVGLVFCICLSHVITQGLPRVARFFSFLADYSFDIYLLSWFVEVPIRLVSLRILGAPGWVIVPVTICAAIALPIAASVLVVRRFRSISYTILGGWKPAGKKDGEAFGIETAACSECVAG